MPPRPLIRGDDSLWSKHKSTIIGLVVLGGLGLGWLVFHPGPAGMFDDGSRWCSLPAYTYRYVKVNGGKGALESMMYVSATKDEISEKLVAHSASESSPMPTQLYVDFYKSEVCKDHRAGLCQGLVLDIGAHVGSHAIFLAQLGFEVHAFEPYHTSAELLRCSQAANELHHMRVVEEGVSNENAIECILQPMTNSEQMATFLPKGTAAKCTKDTAVQMVTLDHYWEFVLEKRNITLIKVDVEGHEQYVLEGATKLLATSPPRYILIEYYPKGMAMKQRSSQKFLSTIYDSRYRIYDCQQHTEIPEGADGKDLLAKYEETNIATDFLLVREVDYPNKVPLPHFSCGY